jgi:starch phosphorylase
MEYELGWLRNRLGVDRRRFLAVGRVNQDAQDEPFVMTVLGLRGSRRRNAVSSLHGDLTRRMWNGVYPGRSEEEVPIGHITNGVHALSWIAPAMKQVYDRALGPTWPVRQADPDTWRHVDQISPTELWETHLLLRRRLVDFVRRRLGSTSMLDARALTIGFARRFTAYKRPTLILSDLDRLARLLGQADAPVQIVFAGKAHPRDEGGKALIREVVGRSRDPRFVGRLVFVEDYDFNVARHLVQGVDVWLNTPLRPLEASGTSGQKAAINGVLNLSILDGWWAEAYDGFNGFAIGSADVHADAGVQWRRDATSLYDTLEAEVLPSFFDTDRTGLPLRWIDRMRRSIRMLAWRYNADRMVMDYVTRCYLPAAGARTTGM